MPDERRALLTDTEREILETNGEIIGEHYTDDYYYTVVSRVRKKIQRLNDDIQALEEHPTLYNELLDEIPDE